MKKVKVYSTKSCPYCYMAKDYLKAKGVDYDDIDVNADMKSAMEMVKISGQRGVPVIDISGNIIVGFDKARIDSLI